MSLILVLNQIVNDQIKEKNVDNKMLTNFMNTHEITMIDIFFRKFTINGFEPTTLIDVLCSNNNVLLASILEQKDILPIEYTFANGHFDRNNKYTNYMK